MQAACIFGATLLAMLLSGASAQAAGKKDGRPPAVVYVAEVRAGEAHDLLRLVGSARSARSATVGSAIMGRVQSLLVREGERVRKGEALIRLRTRQLDLEVEERLAALAEVEAQIEKARADVERGEQLHAGEFLATEQLEARRTQLEALKEQAAQLKATMDRSRDRRARSVAVAPFDGVVVAEHTEVGEWLLVGQPIVDIAAEDPMRVRVQVPERSIRRIEPGQVAQLRFEALGAVALEGRVATVIPKADEASRSFPVDIEVANAAGEIFAGMLTHVTLLLPPAGDSAAALLVPKDAYVPAAQGPGHVVKVAGDKAVKVSVEMLYASGDAFAVSPVDGELQAGEPVVTRGNERLRPGQAVRIAQPASPAAH